MKSAATAFITALIFATTSAKDITLTWKDCGVSSTKTKITGFTPPSVTLGQKTKMTGRGQLSEEVAGATFDLTMAGVIGTLLHCSGDASASKTCDLPYGSGSLTFDAISFPIAAGTSAVNVDISLKSTVPAELLKTKTVTKATAKNGDALFCMEIDSAPAKSVKNEVAPVADAPSVAVKTPQVGCVPLCGCVAPEHPTRDCCPGAHGLHFTMRCYVKSFGYACGSGAQCSHDVVDEHNNTHMVV
jgi:hypothetical protein